LLVYHPSKGTQTFADEPTEDAAFAICIRLPLPPGTLPTLWGDDARFESSYLCEHPGYYLTGDGGYLDDDGYLYLVDRVKDLIIVSGFNVYPAEVEEVLMEHPAVREVGVVGVPHPHTGEAVKAFVVLEAGAAAHEDTLVSWCLDHLARYKCPSKILFVDELPRNVSGKLLRRSLI
jgi:acyl-coenzyme A synthetase/AMP-(fatty) acid ligase